MVTVNCSSISPSLDQFICLRENFDDCDSKSRYISAMIAVQYCQCDTKIIKSGANNNAKILL